MRTSMLVLLALCACSSPNYVGHVTSPPPRWSEPAPSSSRPATTNDDAADRFLQQEIERKSGSGGYVVPRDTRQSYEPETVRFLGEEIERKTPPPAPEVRYVERSVYVDRPYSYGPYEYRRRSTFPWGTAYGAGIGAIIGHQSHRTNRGAWIGGGIGLLFDLAHWH